MVLLESKLDNSHFCRSETKVGEKRKYEEGGGGDVVTVNEGDSSLGRKITVNIRNSVLM